MKKTINRHHFIDEMMSYYDGKGFTRKGLSVLFDYLKKWEEDTGEEIELDPVVLHCQFTEMTVKDFTKEYLTNDVIEELLNELEVGEIEEVTSSDFINYYNNNFISHIIILYVDDNKIIVDIVG